MRKRNRKLILMLIAVFLLSLPFCVRADSLGEERRFFVSPFFDEKGRERVTATMEHKGVNLYFYVDNEWWRDLSSEERSEAEEAMDHLSGVFISEIYPVLRRTFGSEWRLGIDGSKHITVLVHPMKEEAGGYTRTADEYSAYQVQDSNEREMLYLNSDHLTSSLASSYLAHEFTHLITFNQKERLRGVSEEVWLNEARAEYAPTLLGYDEMEQSNLEKRLKIFLDYPSDSLTEWRGLEKDYGVLNIFTQYLAEKYGTEVLSDSLQSNKKGIESIDYALEENGFDADFSELFIDFLVAVYANDCSLGDKYCFDKEDLEEVRVSPNVNFLPLKGSSSLGVSQKAKNWEGNWYKFVGGRKGALKIQFIGNPDNEFRVAYLVRDYTGKYALNFLELSEDQRGKILVPGFGTDVSSVTLIPLVTTKKSGFSENEKEVPFFWEATTITEEEELEKEKDGNGSGYIQRPISEMSRGEVLAKIAELESLLEQLRAQLSSLSESQEGQEGQVGGERVPSDCEGVSSDLRVGMRGEEVLCLQEFLKNQGEEIYPEGLVTGYFGPLTKRAVVRFQERYREEVLGPWDLDRGTGFVGETTRKKINEMMSI